MHVFLLITLPLMKRVIVIVLLIRLMDAFRAFDLVYIITKGGPGISTETLILNTWRKGFAFFEMGSANAVAMFMLYIVLVICWLLVRLLKNR